MSPCDAVRPQPVAAERWSGLGALEDELCCKCCPMDEQKAEVVGEDPLEESALEDTREFGLDRPKSLPAPYTPRGKSKWNMTSLMFRIVVGALIVFVERH